MLTSLKNLSAPQMDIVHWESWVFLSTTIGLFILLAVLTYQKKNGGAFIALLAGTISGAFLYLDHISEIAATATSLTIKVREASDALDGLRKLATLTGATLIYLDAESGALGGDPANHRDQLKQQVLQTLETIGIDQEAIKQVVDAGRDRDVGDYIFGISRHVYNCTLAPTRQSEWTEDFNKLSKNWPPSPDVIHHILEEYNVNDTFTNKALDEYRYFMGTGQHRDTQFWHDRDSWPTDPSIVGCRRQP